MFCWAWVVLGQHQGPQTEEDEVSQVSRIVAEELLASWLDSFLSLVSPETLLDSDGQETQTGEDEASLGSRTLEEQELASWLGCALCPACPSPGMD